MKIMIDGHNLGLKEPTGIGVYASNLACCLNKMEHDVSILYSMKTRSSRFPNNVSFFQKLALEGESPSSGLSNLIYQGLPYYVSYFLRQGVRPKRIQTEFEILNKSLSRKLPENTTPYNLAQIYRTSQAFSALTGKSIPLGVPYGIDKLDVFHSTLPLPISKGAFKKVVTLHDLIPIKLPHSTAINLKHYAKIIKASLQDADIIFSVSEQTKKDAIEIFGIDEEKIYVTFQASVIPPSIKDMSDTEIQVTLDLYNLKKMKYFIFYGAIEPKKNVLRLLQAFVKSNTDCKLVVLGKNGWLFDQEEAFFRKALYNKELREKIVRVEYSHFIEVMTLLKGARALVFPSLYEGFGLPVLEAMQIGTPVITSNQGSLPEIAGDAAHFVDPYSISDIKNAIEKYSSNSKQLHNMTLSGYRQSEKFNEKEYKKKLSLGYEYLFK